MKVQATIENLKMRTEILPSFAPEWGTWIIIEIDLDWYTIRGRSGERVLFKDDLDGWEIV